MYDLGGFGVDDRQRWIAICGGRGLTGFISSWHERERLFFALTTLLQRPYFSRLWTVQECVLARRLVFQAGDERLDSAALTTILKDLKFISHSCLRGVQAKECFLRPSAIVDLQSAIVALKFRPHPVGRLKIDPSAILDMSRRRSAHDDRDKVWGLLGMLKQIDPGLASLLHPIYRLSVEAVYMQAMQALLRRCCSPQPLRFCCAHRDSPKYSLPSRCDDWSSSSDCGIESPRHLYQRPSIYHAADSRPFYYTCVISNKSLEMNGTNIDELEAVSLPGTLSNESKTPPWAKWISIVGGVAPFASLIRILLADHDPDSADSTRASQEYVEQKARKLSDLSDNHIGYHHLMRWMWRDAPRAAAMIDDAFTRKLLFRTKGGLFGLSCRHATVGDKVCLIDGGSLPFLVRQVDPNDVQVAQRELFEKHDKVYQLLGGECYIHGLADGEMGHLNAERKDTICLV